VVIGLYPRGDYNPITYNNPHHNCYHSIFVGGFGQSAFPCFEEGSGLDTNEPLDILHGDEDDHAHLVEYLCIGESSENGYLMPRKNPRDEKPAWRK